MKILPIIVAVFLCPMALNATAAFDKNDGGKHGGGKHNSGRHDGGKHDGGKHDGGRHDDGRHGGDKHDAGKRDGGRHGGGKHDDDKDWSKSPKWQSESSSHFGKRGRESIDRNNFSSSSSPSPSFSSSTGGSPDKDFPDRNSAIVGFASGGSVERTTTKTSSSSSSSTTVIGSEITGSTSKGSVVFGGHDYICDCSDCVQHTYELTDEDLTFVTISISTETWTSNSTDVEKMCGLQFTKLRNDNEQLISQLKSVQSFVATITNERNSIVTELNTCSQKYTIIQNNFVNITTVVNNLKMQLQDALNDNSKLKTQWIAATADLQNWKTKSNNFEMDLKRALESNGQLKVTVNEYSTTITNLRSTINDITIKNNKCGNDSNEWKRKLDEQIAKTDAYEKRIQELEATNDDLTSRITKLTNDLTGCRNGNKQNDIEINKFKDTVTDLTKQLSKCTVDLGTCNTALKKVTDDFDADQVKDLEKEKLRAKIELQLGECTKGRSELELNLATERANVDKCKTEITTTRNDCSKRYEKYEIDITELKSNYQISIDNCESSLKVERDNNANSRTEITNWKNRFTELETKLSITVKSVEDWQKKSQSCDDDSKIVKQKIETLQINVADVNKHLSTCVANANSLQIEITTWKSKTDNCNGELDRSKKIIIDNELIIGNFNTTVPSLEAAKKKCQSELFALRCDVDQFLKNTKSSQEKINNAIDQALSSLDADKKFLGNFINSHDTTCIVQAL